MRPDGIPEAFPATSADTDRLAAVLAESFHADPLAVWAFPDPARRAAILPEFFLAHLDIALDHDGVLTTAERNAALLFLPPAAREKVESRGEELADRFGDLAGEYRTALLTVMDLQARHHPAGWHYYVSFGGIAAGARGGRTSVALGRAFLDRVDAERAGIYTEASSAAGAAVARRTGFVPLGADIVLPDGPALRPLWRDPR